MNERIKELADQASLYARSDNSSMLFENYHNRYTDKFAELIVRECSQISKDYQRNYYESHGARIAKKIKEHFGVEE